jgi:hypothetical protein
MPERTCACQNFERLEGAATQAYLTNFLERKEAASGDAAQHYRCRVCGARWERLEAEGTRRPSLVRLTAGNRTPENQHQ